MSDEEEQAFRNKLQELRNLGLNSDMPVVGKDFREVILRQMELTHALFERQHRDVSRQMGTIRKYWEKEMDPGNWFNPAFEDFINNEIIPTGKMVTGESK
jgi:hypothetical protein